MAKFYGAIGYAELVETAPGVWKDKITERKYYGELIRDSRDLQPTGNVNDDIKISRTISILADPFANQNFHLMRYVQYIGVKWKISKVEVQTPRLILTTGGVYNVT